MDLEKHKKSLLDKYLKGELSKNELHELEKLALDDPFLFEALEGFTEVKEVNDNDITRIKNKLHINKSKQKKRSLVPYGIAASLLVLLGISVWTLTPKNFESEKTFAEAEVTKAAQEDLANVDVQVAHKSSPSSSSIVLEEKLKKTNGFTEIEDKSEYEKEVAHEIPETVVQEVINEFPETRSQTAIKEVVANENQNVPSNKDMLFDEAEPVLSELPDSFMLAETTVPEPRQAEQVEMDYVLENSTTEILASKSKQAKSEVLSQNNVEVAGGVAAESVVVDGLKVKNNNFNTYLIESLENNFTKKQIRTLKKEVTIKFELLDGKLTNFELVPTQDSSIENKFEEIMKAGIQFLPAGEGLFTIPLKSL